MKEYLPRTGYWLFALFFFQSFLTPVWSQTPANDNCEDVTPTVLTNGTPVTFTGTTEGATASTVEINSLGVAVVWQAVTLTAQYNNLTIDFCGTPEGNMGQLLPYFTNSCSLNEIISANLEYSCSDGNASYSFNYIPAGTYYLPVLASADWGNTLGEYSMNVLSENSPVPILANDNCESVTPTTLINGTPVSFTGTTEDATGSAKELSSFGVAAVWEAITLTECSTLTINYCGTPAGNMTQVLGNYVNNCSLNGIESANVDTTACSDGNATYTFQHIPAGTYYLPVLASEDWGNTLGEYTMNVVAVACPPAPENDNCADVTPTVLSNGTQVTFTGTTEMQTATQDEENVFGTGVVWEAITLTGERNNLKVDFCGTGGQFKPQIHYTNSCTATEIVEPLLSNSNECSDGNNTGYFYNLPAGTYYLPVRLDPSANNPAGSYTMNVLSEDAPPAPDNDNCEDVISTELLNGTAVTFTGSTVGATSSATEAVIIGNRTVVWEAITLTGECSILTISYCGTPINTGMNSFITSSCASTTGERIFSSTSEFTSCSDGKLTLRWYNLSAGTYYIPVVTDLSSQTPGEYAMTVLSEDCPPAPANDSCEDLIATTLASGTPVTFTGTTVGATATPQETSLFAKPVVWEAVTLTGACNNLTVDFCGTDSEIVNYWSMLKVYLDSCSATTSTAGVANNTSCEGTFELGTVHFYDLPAGTYYIPIAVNYNNLGEYTMNVISEECPVIPDNDDCEDAIALTCGETYTGSTMGASDSGGNPAKDVFYTYSGNGTEEYVTLSLCASDYDTYIRVYSDCTLTQEIGANDNYCGTKSQVSFTSNGTSTYVVMVEGAGSEFGNYELKVNCIGTDIPVNDNCEDAIALSCGETAAGNTIFATNSGGYDTADVFYSYTGNGEPELVTVSLCGTTFNSYLRIFTDCDLTEEVAASGSSITCPDEKPEVSFVSDGTSTYVIMVEGKLYPENLSKGAYEISLTCDVAPNQLNCETIFIPSDNIQDAMTLGHVGSFGTQYAVDIPVGEQGFTIEGFVPTVLGASNYFNFIFFEDNGGIPGAELFTRAGTIAGSENLGTLFSTPVLKYTVTFDPVAFEPNTAYWVQIDCNSLGWGYTAIEPMRMGYPDVAYNFTDEIWESVESENQLAFELICSTLGVEDLDSFAFTYHPNPVKDVLNISSKSNVESVSVFNVIGQQLINDLKVTNGQMDVSSLTPGTYVFKVMFEEGQIETFKIIKK